MTAREINPKTGKPFKFGDIREDGYVFRQWGRIRPDGSRQPLWMSPTAFKNNREKCKLYHQEQTKKLRNWINELKVFYGCAVCGYNAEPEGLDIDHLHDKKFNIGGETKTNKKRIIEEIKKCQILCGTCHHIKTRSPEKYKKLRATKESPINLDLFLNKSK